MNWKAMMNTSLNERCKEQENMKQSRFFRKESEIK